MDNQATQNIPSIQSQPEIPSTQPINLMKVVFFVLLGLIVAGGLVFAGIEIGKKQTISQQKENITSQTKVSPTTIPTSTLSIKDNPTNPTANWKTYTDSSNSFTFNYPTNYSITEVARPYLNRNITWSYNNDSILNCKGDCPVSNTTEKTTLGGKQATKITGYIGSIGGNIPQNYITYEVSTGVKYFVISIQALPFDMTSDETRKYDQYTTQQIKPEELQIFNQIISTFKFINSNSTIPSSINKIFTQINQTFNSNIIPTKESQFYSLSGFINKTSWKLDLSSLLTEKSQFTILFNMLEKNLKQDINSTADGVGQSVQGYENDQIYCFLLRGFNSSDYISCIEK